MQLPISRHVYSPFLQPFRFLLENGSVVFNWLELFTYICILTMIIYLSFRSSKSVNSSSSSFLVSSIRKIFRFFISAIEAGATSAFQAYLLKVVLEYLLFIDIDNNIISCTLSLFIFRQVYLFHFKKSLTFKKDEKEIEQVFIQNDREKELDRVMVSARAQGFKIEELSTLISGDSNSTLSSKLNKTNIKNITEFKKILLSFEVESNDLTEFKNKEIHYFNSYPLVKSEEQLKKFLTVISKSYHLVFFDIDYLVTFLITSGCLYQLPNKQSFKKHIKKSSDINEFAYDLLQKDSRFFDEFFPK